MDGKQQTGGGAEGVVHWAATARAVRTGRPSISGPPRSRLLLSVGGPSPSQRPPSLPTIPLVGIAATDNLTQSFVQLQASVAATAFAPHNPLPLETGPTLAPLSRDDTRGQSSIRISSGETREAWQLDSSSGREVNDLIPAKHNIG